MKHVLCLTVGFLAIAGLAGPAFSHLEEDLLVPSPGCIQAILNSDTVCSIVAASAF